MPKFVSIHFHTVIWLCLWVLYFAVPYFWYPQTLVTGRWGSRKHLYSLQTTNPRRAGVHTDTFEDVVRQPSKYNGDRAWPSGSKMNQFKNELGCFGEWQVDVYNTMNTHETTNNTHETSQLLMWQATNSRSEYSVCTCIDQLYYASFQSVDKQDDDSFIPSVVKDRIKQFFSTNTDGVLRQWMLGRNEEDGSAGTYKGIGFTALMQETRSDHDYVVCNDEGGKKQKHENEQLHKAQCMMRRDVEIIGVCTRSAAAQVQINENGVLNSSHIKAFAVLSLFMYVFVTMVRYETSYRWYTVLTIGMCLNITALTTYWVFINFAFLWAYTPQWSIVNVVVSLLSYLGAGVAWIVLFATFSRLLDIRSKDIAEKGTQTVSNVRGKQTTEKPRLIQKLLTTDPMDTTVLVVSQVLVDVNCITGFSLLLLSLLLEAGVTEMYSLIIAVLMVVVAAFVQHLSNILRYVQVLTLAQTSQTIANERLDVSNSQFRLLNECASCRLYVGLVVTLICVYLLISPRGSQMYPGMDMYTLAVLILFLTCNGFDVVREVETHMTKTAWLSEHDTDNTRSCVLMVLVIAMIVHGGVHNFAYTGMESVSGVTAQNVYTYGG